MSMLDSFFNRGFKASNCKTLLKLTIPRIKLLRNRREIQLKQMRRDIAKLLETGQEATARVRVEHIVREENMMAAQEILELFCELISVRIPIIEAQRECPLDLKEAISSICFAAPRCSDLPELLQVHMLFASKYGKEFVASATELMPDCCVNRQLIELLSVRAPSPGKKLKLLKEIAKEHELDWDPSATETEFAKQHEDLLNALTSTSTSAQASVITMLPLPEEKHDEILNSGSNHCHSQEPKSDSGFDPLDFPEVPKVPSSSSQNVASASEVASPLLAVHHEPSHLSATSNNSSQEAHSELENVLQEKQSGMRDATLIMTLAAEEKSKKTQFVPFISSPSDFSDRFSPRPTHLPPATASRTTSVSDIDLQDVLAAAQAAAETAECAATAARSAATLAQTRISELSKKNSDSSTNYSNENPFHNEVPDHYPVTTEESQFNGQNFNSSDHHEGSKLHFDHQESFGALNGFPKFQDPLQFDEDKLASESPDLSFHKFEVKNNSYPDELVHGSIYHRPQRVTSMDDDSYFVYPNLFSSQKSDVGSGAQP